MNFHLVGEPRPDRYKHSYCTTPLTRGINHLIPSFARVEPHIEELNLGRKKYTTMTNQIKETNIQSQSVPNHISYQDDLFLLAHSLEL